MQQQYYSKRRNMKLRGLGRSKPIPVPERAPRSLPVYDWAGMKLGGKPMIVPAHKFASAIVAARQWAKRRAHKGIRFAQRTNAQGVREIWRIS